MERILVVDDDENICRALSRFLTHAGYEVRSGGCSADLYKAAAEWEPHAIVLDVCLGKEDGRELVRSFRAMYQTPILMLTGLAGIDDRISGLDSGADDYLCKPFDNGELLARVKALLRRAPHDPSDEEEKPISLDRVRRVVVTPGGGRQELTELQANLLAVLLERVGQVVSREEIYSLVFRRPWVPSDRSLEVHMSNLRKLLGKIEPDRVEIVPVRHVGYRLLMDSCPEGE